MKLIQLKGKYGEGKYAKVDDEDYDFLSQLNWYVNDGYVKTYYQGKHVKMHQLIVGSHYDHENQDKLDNQRENLRPCTQRQNNANVKTRAKSGYKGVYKDGLNDSYRVHISINGKMYALGSFGNPRWAALAFSIAAKDVHGEFACLDFTADEIVGIF